MKPTPLGGMFLMRRFRMYWKAGCEQQGTYACPDCVRFCFTLLKFYCL